MNAHVGHAQTLKFRAQSLLAYVLEPVQPLAEWFTALDAWLARSPTFFIARPVILDMAALDITLKEYRDLLSGLARRHIRVMGAENVDRGPGRTAPASGRFRRAANRSADAARRRADRARGRGAGRRANRA